MPVSQRRGPYAKTQARRAEIARAALDVVTTDGHKAVTVASVAARSGLSEATVAYHFATRDHLLVAAVELSNEVMAEGADIDLLAGVSRTGEFLSLMAAVGTSSRNRLALFEAMAAEAADPDHPAHAWLNRHYGTLLTVEPRVGGMVGVGVPAAVASRHHGGPPGHGSPCGRPLTPPRVAGAGPGRGPA